MGHCQIDFWLIFRYPKGTVLNRSAARNDRMLEKTVTIVRTFVCSTILVVL